MGGACHKSDRSLEYGSVHTEDRIGEYTLIQALNRGPRGPSWLCRHPASGSVCVIKQVKSEQIAENLMFMKSVRHPNLSKFYEIFTIGNDHYLVYEYISGHPIAALGADGQLSFGPTDEVVTRRFIQQLVMALQAIQSHGVPACLLTPSNIFVRDDGAIKNGLALTHYGVMSRVNTIPQWASAFLSPEQLNATSDLTPYGASSDMWGLGVLLYLLLHGRVPFKSARAALTESAPQSFALTISPQCREVLSRLLCKDPNLRITAVQLLDHPWLRPLSIPVTPSLDSLLSTNDIPKALLILDWSEETRENMKNMFGAITCTDIYPCSESKEAIYVLHQHLSTIFVVILGMEINEKDVLQACREIRNIEGHSLRIYLVAVVSEAANEIKNKCLSCGIDRLVVSPMTDDKVQDILLNYGFPIKQRQSQRNYIDSSYSSSSKKPSVIIEKVESATNSTVSGEDDNSTPLLDDLYNNSNHFAGTNLSRAHSRRNKNGHITITAKQEESPKNESDEEEHLPHLMSLPPSPMRDMNHHPMLKSSISSNNLIVFDAPKIQMVAATPPTTSFNTNNNANANNTFPNPLEPDLRTLSINSLKRSAMYYKQRKTPLNDFCEFDECLHIAVSMASDKFTRNERIYSNSIDWKRLVENLRKSTDPHNLKEVTDRKLRVPCSELEDIVNKQVAEWRNDSAVHPLGLAIPNGRYETFVSVSKGKRSIMEDIYLNLPTIGLLNDMNNLESVEHRPVIGIFDGHGGDEAAIYAKRHLLTYLLSSSSYPHDLCEALKHAFTATHNSFISKAIPLQCDAGTTAVVAFMDGDILWVASVGDSRAVLFSAGEPRMMTSLHTVKNEEEAKLVKERGGALVFNGGSFRVNGMLLVTRSIGDVPCHQYLSSEPEIISYKIEYGVDEFLVLASDGIWDVLTEDEVCEHLRATRNEVDLFRSTLSEEGYIKEDHTNNEEEEGFEDYTLCLDSLVSLAIERGSTDNVSVAVMFFYPSPTPHSLNDPESIQQPE